MAIFSFLTTLLSVIPSLFALAAGLLTAILIPVLTATILGILELVTGVVSSTESVLLLILSPPILLFPLKLVRAIGTPVVEGGLVVFAPAVYPFQALALCLGGVLSFVFEFKVCSVISSLCWLLVRDPLALAYARSRLYWMHD